MPRNRFFELRSYVHFVDKLSITPNEREENRLVLVKPILTSFRNACLELPRSRDVSIDEQMIPFSGRCPVRQCVPSKPNPVGLKNFVMASPDGLVLDFAIYVGKGTVSVEDMREFGLGGSIIKKLVATLKRDQHTFLFTDRYFTDMKIAEHLVDENIFLTGTVMANRTGGVAAAMPQDRDMKRGDSHCKQRLDLLTFKMDIAIALIKAETSPRSKRLRETEADSDDEEVNARGKKRGKVTALPPDDVRSILILDCDSNSAWRLNEICTTFWHDSYAVLPSCWLSEHKEFCLWPIETRGSEVMAMAERQDPPKEN
ncbi:hypothetical protein HPB49_024856 [Dermacentor silvarum]|uniref:Uncharacterized protein n=1 Tax=Dermacentor silvarum TaxID=543639 RepID=A0ACB8D919_DERSI|nr:hypothetical protein HPB49_024856 [Dermacentor silvarum]